MSKRKVTLVRTTPLDRSPCEQGELDTSSSELAVRSDNESNESDHGGSPEDKHLKETEKGHEIELEEEDEEDEEDNDDGLLIKPPPAPVKKKDKHKRKHKIDKKKAKQRDKHRSDKGRSHRDKGTSSRVDKEIGVVPKTEKEPVAVQREREPVRIVEVREDNNIRIVHDRKQTGIERERELKEKLLREQEKREKSRLERERLERLEREKNRDRKIREERMKRDEEKRRRKQEERRLEQQKREREEIRNRKERIKEKERLRQRSRSPDKDHRSDSKQNLRDTNKGSNPKDLEKDNVGGNIYLESSADRPERTSAHLRLDGNRREEKPDKDTEDEKAAHSLTDAESANDSDSDSGTESETMSDSDDSSEDDEEDDHEEDDDEAHEDADTHDQEDKKHIAKSKFDEHSATESETESIHFNDEHGEDGGLLQETPPMSPVELKPDLPLYFPAIQGCRNVEEFSCLNRIEEGTYGVVYRARDRKTGEIVALKRLKMEKEKEGFPITSLREINTLLKSQHENIVTVREIVVGSNMDKIYIVMEYVEHDLKSLMECSMKQPFLIGEVKTLLLQLLRGVQHLHDNWIIHRDLKTSNLLLSHKGILKIGDFGLAREYGDPLKSYTPIVVTLWYRSPELLLGTKLYSTPIDLWSVGCIFAEFLTMKAIWQGKSEIDQLQKIFKELGTPTEKIWPGVMELPGMKKCSFTEHPYNTMRNKFGQILSDQGFTLLNKFLTYNPAKRITAAEALQHDFFKESPLPVDPSMFPTWPAKSEQTRKHASSPKPPSGGKAYAKLLDDNDDVIAGGFQFVSATKGVSASGPGFSLKF